jgi:Flp pilus assembly protein TadD
MIIDPRHSGGRFNPGAGLALLLGAVLTLQIVAEAKADAVQDCLKGQDASVQINGCSQLLRLVKTDEQAAAVRLKRGSAYLQLNDYGSAIADLNEAIRLRPNEANTYIVRAAAYQKHGELREAASDVERAIQLKPELASKLNPSLAAIEFQLGRQLLDKKQFSQAIAAFTMVIKLKPDAVEAYALRGLTYQESGQKDKGDADLAEATRRKPELAQTLVAGLHRERGLALQKNDDLKGAFAEYNQAVQADPEAWSGYYLRGFLLMSARRYGPAQADLNKAQLLLSKLPATNAEERKQISEALAELPLEAQMEERWTRYLRRIQAQGRYENWPGPPYDLYKRDHALE